MRTMLTMVKVVQIVISDNTHTVYITFTAFETFQNCCWLCVFWLLRNFYSDETHHASYGERFQIIISDVAHTVYISFKAF